jgi:hypothetical protein
LIFFFIANRLLQSVLYSLAVIFAQPLSKLAPEFMLFSGDGGVVCSFQSGYFVVVFVACLWW